MDIAEIWPPYACVIRMGEFTLSPVRETDYPELADLARGGVRQTGVNAFLVPWDTGSDVEIARSIAQYQWSIRAAFTIERWSLEFIVRHRGQAIGVQGVSASHYLLTRTVETGSWLGRSLQGFGYGTLMRHALIAAFAEQFGAETFHSGHFAANDASRRVSEKLGYRPNGEKTITAAGDIPLVEKRVILAACDIPPTPVPLVVEGVAELRAFLGLEKVGGV